MTWRRIISWRPGQFAQAMGFVPQLSVSWDSWRGWGCILALVMLSAILDGCTRMLLQESYAFREWLRANSTLIQGALKMLLAALWLTIAYLFSGSRSVGRFFEDAGLRSRPTLSGCLGAWGAAGLATLDRYGGVRGMTSPDPTAQTFYHHGGLGLLFFVAFVVSVGPFYEEVVFRGFVYRSLRSAHGWLLTTLVAVSLAAYFHHDTLTRSIWAAGCLSALWILLCVVREHTRSSWNCVLCHAAYNAAQVFAWQIWLPGLLVASCGCSIRAAKTRV